MNTFCNIKKSSTLCVVLLAVMGVCGTAVAQTDEGAQPPAETDAMGDKAEAASDDAATDVAPSDDGESAPEETGSAATDTPDPSEDETGAKAEATDEGDAEQGDEDAEAEEADSESIVQKGKEFFSAVGVRQLRGEDYPTYKVRGIKGGSLYNTFHGLQWPYMPDSGIGFSGYVWVDLGYEKISSSYTDPEQYLNYLLHYGRFVLRTTPTYSLKRWFIQGQAEFVANIDQTQGRKEVADTDDLWVRVGVWDLFDLQLGRFESWELYHFGMGMDLNTLERRGATDISDGNMRVPSIYGGTFMFERPNGLGNVAAHLYPLDYLRFELLGRFGNDIEDPAELTYGVRGAGILDFGWIKVKGGGEYKKQKSKDGGPEEASERGVGGTVQFVFDPYIEFGANGGWAITDRLDPEDRIDAQGSYTTWSAGGFANVRIIDDLLLGGGGNFTKFWDIDENDEGEVNELYHIQTFGALQYLLFDQLYIKAVVAWAKGHFDSASAQAEVPAWDSTMISGRLRLQYNF